ncbi:lytic transglycosylase domain-containing protein [Moraxella oculi]|uniref:Lytic transglycosylase domain-containing protein n=1 Tax=Moraxella oculi TaxID=2940516 RepID=A0ABW8UAD6_9GAMM
MVNTTTAIFNKNRAIGVLNATKGLLIGTAGRLGGVMTTLGRAILGVGAIIKAHPIMFIAGIITTVITATMGLENAMKSFGDAVGITGILVQDFVKWSVDGVGKQMTKAIDFMAGVFVSKSKDGTNKASNAFKDFFKTSEGGFVGLLEITAKIFDKIVTMAKASMLYASSYVGDMVISVKNAYNAMMPSWMGGGGEQQAQRNMSFADALFQSESFALQNMVGNAITRHAISQTANDKALQYDLGKIGDGASSAANGKEKKNTKSKEKDEKYTYTKEELKALQKVHGLIYGSELKKYAEQQAVPVHMLAGLMMQESKGERYAKSHKGALGYFQTTSGYREDMGLSKEDSYDLIKSGKAAIDFLRQSYQDFGNWNDAIRSYNAGRGGARTFNKTGKVSGSSARNKEVAEYVPKIARYAAYFNNGKSELGKNSNAAQQSYEFAEKQLKTQEELLKDQHELILKYSDHTTRQLATLEADRKAVYDAFGQDGEETRKLIGIIEGRYKLSAELRQQEQQLEMYSYKMTTTERMALEHGIHQHKISLNDEYTEAERTAYKDAVSEKYKHDLEMFKKLQDEKVKEINNPIVQALNDQAVLTTKRLNKNSMRPDDYRRWELSQEIAAAKDSSERSYEDRVQAIEKKDSDGRYEIESEKEREHLLEEAYRLHKETLANIDAEYGEKSKLLNDELLSAKLQSYGAAAGALAGLFKDMSGEQSKAYRAMFAVSKAYALADTGIKMGNAIASAWSDPSATTIWQKMANAARVAIEQGHLVSMINAINPKGFKTGGYTGNIGVNSIAGVVHGQEYVMNAKATKRIGVNNLERLSNGEGIGGVKVIINNCSNETATAEQMPNGDVLVTVGKMSRHIAQDEIQKYHRSQLRQGGIHYGR